MAGLSLKNITKVYPNGFEAVKDFNLEIADKEFIIFVGPSGCGKTTTLRMIAGLEDISSGELKIGDRVVNDVEPKDRDIAMVFQNYALYPHMTVYDNMAFGLKLRKTPKDQIDKMVKEAEEKCKQMLSEANSAAAENTRSADALVAVEQARVEEAKAEAVTRIEQLQDQIKSCIDALERIKVANLPAQPAVTAFDYDRVESRTSKPSQADKVADEISANLQALVGTTEEALPVKTEPKHPVSDTTGKFANLRFGPHYDPTNP